MKYKLKKDGDSFLITENGETIASFIDETLAKNYIVSITHNQDKSEKSFFDDTYELPIITFDSLDLENEYFDSQKTNLWLDYIKPKLVFYNHGERHPLKKYDAAELYAIGEFVDVYKSDNRLMGKFKLYNKLPNNLKQYLDFWNDEFDEFQALWLQMIKDRLDNGQLAFSSDSIKSITKRMFSEKGTLIKSWGVGFASLTNIPAEPKNMVNNQTLDKDSDSKHKEIYENGDSSKTFVIENNIDDKDNLEMEPKVKDKKEIEAETIVEKAEGDMPEDMEKMLEGDAEKEMPSAITTALQPLVDALVSMGMDNAKAMEHAKRLLLEMLGAGSDPVVSETVVEESDEMPEDVEAGYDTVEGMTKGVNINKVVKSILEELNVANLPTKTRSGFAVNDKKEKENMEIPAVHLKNEAPLIKSINAIRHKDTRSMKALGINPGQDGGYMVPLEQSNEIIELLRAKSVFLNGGDAQRRVRFLPMSSDTLQVPVVSGGSTAYWVGENSSITESQNTFAQRKLVAKKLAILIPVSNELMRNAIPAFEATLRNDMAAELAQAVDRAILTGNGGKEILGIVNQSGVTKTPLNANPTYDNLVDTIQRIETSNVELDDSAAWLFNPSVKAVLRKLEDGAGQLIWTDSGSISTTAGANANSQLLGYPWISSTNVLFGTNGNAANETNIFYGKWSDLIVGMLMDMEIVASTEAGTAFQNDQTWIRAILRLDAVLAHPESIQVLENVTVA